MIPNDILWAWVYGELYPNQTHVEQVKLATSVYYKDQQVDLLCTCEGVVPYA